MRAGFSRPTRAGSHTGDSYVLRDGDVTYMLGQGMSGEALKSLKVRFGPEFLWARRLGRAYVIRDAETIAKARVVIRKTTANRTEGARTMSVLVDAAGRAGKAQPAD